MGIYSASTIGGYDFDYTAVKPALESANYTAMAIEAVAESEANYNMIMKAIAVNEASYFAENGVEVVYEAGGLSGFFAKVKEFFVKLWNKIKEIFHKFFAWLDSLTKSNKDFAKKYEAEVRKRWDKIKDSFSVKGYKFSNLPTDPKKVRADAESAVETATGIAVGDFATAIELYREANQKASAYKDIDNEIKKFEADAELESVIRGAMIKSITGKGGEKLDDSEFTKGLFTAFRSGEENKEVLEKSDIDIESVIRELKESKTAEKTAKDNYKSMDDEFKKTIREIEDAQKAVNKLSELKTVDDTVGGKEYKAGDVLGKVTNLASKCVNCVKFIHEKLATFQGAKLQALKDQATQNKHIVVAVIGTGKVEESAQYSDYGYSESASMDFLNSVVLK